MFFSSIKGINRPTSKGMWNIYLKVTINKNCWSQDFDLLSLKICLQVSFWRALTLADIIEFQNLLLQFKNQRLGCKTVCGFPIILILKGIICFKDKEFMHFVEQKYKLWLKQKGMVNGKSHT